MDSISEAQPFHELRSLDAGPNPLRLVFSRLPLLLTGVQKRVGRQECAALKLTMGAECCNKDCLKPSVVSYGVVAWLSSGAALGVGIWMLVEKSTYNSLLDSLFYPATIYILIAAGTFGFIFAVFGCAGAMTDSRCMLALFWITSFVAFAALGSTGFLALYYHDNVLRKDINIRQAINESETNKDLMTVIDKLQTEGCEGSLETWVRENVFRAGWIALGLSLVQVSS
uniref:Tetraspanin n=1 Tax=Branchiostoma floridae TaxID=7739 RepID=C3ZVY3_BRAFL|eukprot:XP_002587271.1 hypothetical protein BRAFLDRAFT_99786 [Branchiostoma floridae]